MTIITKNIIDYLELDCKTCAYKSIIFVMVNLKKVSRLVLVSALAVSSMIPAHAGVVTGKMVEVDEELRQQLDASRVKIEECESSKARLDQRAQELDSKIAALVDKLKSLAADNDRLQGEVNGLKTENQKLLSERIENLKQTTVTETTTTTTKQVVAEEDTCSPHPVKSFVGIVVGAPISTVTGTIRGAVSKGVQVSDSMNEALGESLPAQLVSKTFGLVGGAVIGTVTGLVKGLIDGIRYGFCKPLTAKNISLDGHFVNDWNSFEIPGKL